MERWVPTGMLLRSGLGDWRVNIHAPQSAVQHKLKVNGNTGETIIRAAGVSVFLLQSDALRSTSGTPHLFPTATLNLTPGNAGTGGHWLAVPSVNHLVTRRFEGRDQSRELGKNFSIFPTRETS